MQAPLSGSLADALRNGEVLCNMLNLLKPGLVPKVHPSPRMAFRQMENIGWFLEGCKEFGVPSTDLFMTVDLFDAPKNVELYVNVLEINMAINDPLLI